MQNVGEDLRRAIGDTRRVDTWWAEETAGIEAGEYFTRRGKEDREAESEEIWRVARGGKDVAWDTEVFIANLNKDFRLKELGLETRY